MYVRVNRAWGGTELWSKSGRHAGFDYAENVHGNHARHSQRT